MRTIVLVTGGIAAMAAGTVYADTRLATSSSHVKKRVGGVVPKALMEPMALSTWEGVDALVGAAWRHLAASAVTQLRATVPVFAPSPVRVRHELRMARTRKLTRRRAAELAVFRKTQREEHDVLIADAAQQWGIDPFLLKGLLATESGLDARLRGGRIYAQLDGKRVPVGGGARGIAQFTTAGIAAVNEARQRRQRRGEYVQPFVEANVWNPQYAIAAAAELLSSNMRRFGRDGGITAYNSGQYGGRLVQRFGFYRARRTGKLARVGRTALQGYRFLPNVLKRTNRYRQRAGLPRLPPPDHDRVAERQSGS